MAYSRNFTFGQQLSLVAEASQNAEEDSNKKVRVQEMADILEQFGPFGQNWRLEELLLLILPQTELVLFGLGNEKHRPVSLGSYIQILRLTALTLVLSDRT